MNAQRIDQILAPQALDLRGVSAMAERSKGKKSEYNGDTHYRFRLRKRLMLVVMVLEIHGGGSLQSERLLATVC
jgi:hypothetical protein